MCIRDSHDRITVKPILFHDETSNNLLDIAKDHQHVMVDEFFENFYKLSDKSQKEFKDMISTKHTVWMALSNTYHYSRIDSSQDPETLLKTWFPDFDIAKMTTPLRLPVNVAQDLKSRYVNDFGQVTQLRLNQRLMADCSLPSNMAEGCKIEKIGHELIRPLHEALQKGFQCLTEGTFALIIIADSPNRPATKAARDQIQCHQKCKEMIPVLTMDVALAAVGRPPPLYHCIDYTSGEAEVKAWISGQRNQDLITSSELVRGFESPVIIDAASATEIKSRASAQFITVSSNPFLDMMIVSENLLKKDHAWQDLMKRDVRPALTPSISSLLGEVSIDP